MKIRVAGFEPESIVDGTGVRFVIFTQGCPHHCQGCHNPQSHDFNGGTEYDTSDIIKMIAKNPLIQGITLSGGEPFCQQGACLELAREAHRMDLNVWCYTGYRYEELVGEPLLGEIDILVDGEFIESQKSLSLNFRGSTNQRVIDVPLSLKENEVVICF